MFAFESQHRSLCKEKYLKGTTAMSNPYDADSNGDDPEVAATEWTWVRLLCLVLG